MSDFKVGDFVLVKNDPKPWKVTLVPNALVRNIERGEGKDRETASVFTDNLSAAAPVEPKAKAPVKEPAPK